MTQQQLGKGQRVTGTARQMLAEYLAARYDQGASIRSLAGAVGRSYGAAHRLLTEAGVEFRGRGGARPGPRGSER